MRNVVKRNMGNSDGRAIFLSHSDNLSNTKKKFGDNRKIAFVFREPTERFVSAFYSRLRNGRPRFKMMWNVEEAIAFSFFSNPNSLAESLYSEDERLRSAAIFAMNSIVHIKRNYSYYFGSVDALLEEKENIAACIDIVNLSDNLTEFVSLLGFENVEDTMAKPLHTNPMKPVLLSPLATENLRMFWAREYEIYSALKKISESFKWKVLS